MVEWPAYDWFCSHLTKVSVVVLMGMGIEVGVLGAGAISALDTDISPLEFNSP